MLRADALATVHLVHPLLRRRKRRPNRVPILMYHSISDTNEDRAHPYYRTATRPQVFAQHMQFLHDHGYATISLDETVRRLHGSPADAGKRPVAITFDDGFEDIYTDAVPVMQRYGFMATVYLPTAFIGNEGQEFKGMKCLNWGQIRELKSAGMEFGSHTVTHPQLRSVTAAQRRNEVVESRIRIEQELSGPVGTFAYPYAFPETDGAFVEEMRALLKESGYQNGVSTIIGTAEGTDNQYFMRRLPVNSCDDEALFAAKLEGGYDWLHALQYTSKLFSRKHLDHRTNNQETSAS